MSEFKWRLGITTAPRPEGKSFLAETIRHVKRAGWTDIVVFAEPNAICDPGMTPDVYEGVTVIDRPHNFGVYQNWRDGWDKLVWKQADFYAMLQDDQRIRPGLRGYLERTITSTAVYTPYTSKKDHRSGLDGWYRVWSGWNFCGALFFAMNAEMAKMLAARLPAQVAQNRHIDAHLASRLTKWGVDLLAHRPTLVDHLADEYSTAGHGPNPFCRTGRGYIDEEIK